MLLDSVVGQMHNFIVKVLQIELFAGSAYVPFLVPVTFDLALDTDD